MEELEIVVVETTRRPRGPAERIRGPVRIEERRDRIIRIARRAELIEKREGQSRRAVETIGEETVVTDTVETVGQDVDEEAAYDSSPPDLGRGQYRRRIRPSELPAMVVLLHVRCATPPGA